MVNISRCLSYHILHLFIDGRQITEWHHHVIIPLLWGFKNEVEEMHHLKISCSRKRYSFAARKWVDKLVIETICEGYSDGPVLGDDRKTLVSSEKSQ